MAPTIKGAESGISSIQRWFGQFPTFEEKPNSKPDIISQFKDLAIHLDLKDQSTRDKYFRSLLTVVVAGKKAFPRLSGCREVAAQFLVRFPDFRHNLDHSLEQELKRLASQPGYALWKMKAGIKGRVQGRAKEFIGHALWQLLEASDTVKSSTKQATKKPAKQPTKPALGQITQQAPKPAIKPAIKPATKPVTKPAIKPTAKAPKTLPSPSASPLSSSSYVDPTADFFAHYTNFKYDPTGDLLDEFERLAVTCGWKPGSKKYSTKRTECLMIDFEDDFDQIGPDDVDEPAGATAILPPSNKSAVVAFEDMLNFDDAFSVDGGSGVSVGGVCGSNGDGDGDGGERRAGADKLAQWQTLCRELGVDPVPSTVTQCRKALKAVHVNIVDLMEAWQHNRYAEGGLVSVVRFSSAGALARYIHETGKFCPRKKAKEAGAVRALLRHVL